MSKADNPFRYFDSSPEVIRLVVMMYVRFPLSRPQLRERAAQSRQVAQVLALRPGGTSEPRPKPLYNPGRRGPDPGEGGGLRPQLRAEMLSQLLPSVTFRRPHLPLFGLEPAENCCGLVLGSWGTVLRIWRIVGATFRLTHEGSTR
jgi:hypothetical protein